MDIDIYFQIAIRPDGTPEYGHIEVSKAEMDAMFRVFPYRNRTAFIALNKYVPDLIILRKREWTTTHYPEYGVPEVKLSSLGEFVWQELERIEAQAERISDASK